MIDKLSTLVRRCGVLIALVGGLSSADAQLLSPIALVEIGNPNNPANGNGHGSVAEVFYMGQFEVTMAQYANFLNSVASVSDPYGLYNSGMGTDGNVGGLIQSGSEGAFSYSVVSGRENNPVPYISWSDAARMANWLNNGATFGGNTESGAYDMSLTTPTRSPTATWWIPSYNEWYKAAYFDPTIGSSGGYWLYPTQSNADQPPKNVFSSASMPNQANFIDDGRFSVTQSANLQTNQIYVTPVGSFSNSASYYGTFDQGGNLQEWNDTVYANGERGVNGGHWDFNIELLQSSFPAGSSTPTPGSESDYLFTFRLASSVPEPSVWAMFVIGGVGLWIVTARTKRNRGKNSLT